ncbi:MAG: hypothetical protein HOO96_03820, partial [Polyangiaceae bacterium]|nr:hypothetical protein [Polyangiaceae bacterium]
MYLVSRALPYAFVGACIVACGSGAAPSWEPLPDAAATLDAGAPPVDAAVAQLDAPSASDGDAEVDPPSGPGLPFRIEGYGAGTVGGFAPGHDVVKVTSLLDDGPGTLREAIRGAKGPRVVLFEVDGDISLASPLLLPSDLTIDGRGHQVTLRKKGFVIPGTDQI